MLKGDVNRDQKVSNSSIVGSDFEDLGKMIGSGQIPNSLVLESGDIDGNDLLGGADYTILSLLFDRKIHLPDPNNRFNFRVVDQPRQGYVIKNVVINTGNQEVILTPEEPISGFYSLRIDENTRVATVIGQSLSNNDIKFTHELITPAITLQYGTDSHGSITEWMLKGDVNRDGIVTDSTILGSDKDVIQDLINKGGTDDPAILKAADIDNNNSISSSDLSLLSELLLDKMSLPNTNFSFSVTNKPNDSYRVKEVIILTENGKVVLTKQNPIVGTYALSFHDDSVWVTGNSLTKNEV